MIRKFISIVVLFFLCFVCIWAEEENLPQKQTAGVFINRINSFDLKNGIAELDIWYWCVTNEEKNNLDSLELSNGKLQPIGETIFQQHEGKYYVSQRYIATVICLIDVNRFPFDRQKIMLAFEDGEATADEMVFAPDINNSGIDPTFKMNEWHIEKVDYVTGVHNYPTSFGYLDIPSGQGSDYSQMSIIIELVRKGSVCQKLFKYFWAVFISVVVGLFALLIRVNDLDGRFGMAVGSLFANVGCAYILSDQLPNSPELTFAEIISYGSLGFIMLFLVESIISLAIFNRGFEEFSKKLDKWTFIVSIISYVTMWGILLS